MRSRLLVVGWIAMHVCSDVRAPCAVSTNPAPSMRHSSPSAAPVHATRIRLHVLPPSRVVSW
eukprot:12561500-Prorocentrum_lima.AAC.1